MRSLKTAFIKYVLFILLFHGSFLQGAGMVQKGGGDAAALTPLSSDEIQRKIEFYHQFRHELLTTLRLVGLSSKRVLEIQTQLTKPLEAKEKSTAEQQATLHDHIFTSSFDEARVGSIQLNFISAADQGECLDHLGKSYDASVLNSNLNTICFNLNRLKTKLGKENYEVELLALYLRELTHCFGSTEQDGSAVQESMRSLGLKFKEYLTFLNPDGVKLKDTLKEVWVQVNALNIENSKISNVCSEIRSISNKVFTLLQSESVKSTGQSVLGFNGVIAFHAAYVVSSFLNDACDPLMMIRKQIKFKTSKQLKIKELYPDPTMILAPGGLDLQIKLSAYLFADLSDALIVAPQFADKSTLSTNLKELKRLLEILI